MEKIFFSGNLICIGFLPPHPLSPHQHVTATSPSADPSTDLSHNCNKKKRGREKERERENTGKERKKEKAHHFPSPPSLLLLKL